MFFIVIIHFFNLLFIMKQNILSSVFKFPVKFTLTLRLENRIFFKICIINYCKRVLFIFEKKNINKIFNQNVSLGITLYSLLKHIFFSFLFLGSGGEFLLPC